MYRYLKHFWWKQQNRDFFLFVGELVLSQFCFAIVKMFAFYFQKSSVTCPVKSVIRCRSSGEWTFESCISTCGDLGPQSESRSWRATSLRHTINNPDQQSGIYKQNIWYWQMKKIFGAQRGAFTCYCCISKKWVEQVADWLVWEFQYKTVRTPLLTCGVLSLFMFISLGFDFQERRPLGRNLQLQPPGSAAGSRHSSKALLPSRHILVANRSSRKRPSWWNCMWHFYFYYY